MGEMNVRSDAVDVEQIMRQIRARIREKRGVDYTEAELQQLAQVKLEKFLDPRGVRSDLLEGFRLERAESPPNFVFEEDTLFETHRGLLRTLRNLLRPILKLFFNPDRITSALHVQAQVNAQAERRLRRIEDREALYYELIHNLTVEVTRLGIETQNMRMRVESLSSRLDFDERRGRSLENTVQFKPSPQRPQPPTPAAATTDGADQQANGSPAGPEARPTGADGTSGPNERRRRRRRRRRRPGRSMADATSQGAGGTSGADSAAAQGEAGAEPNDDGPDGDDGLDDSDASDQ